MIGTGGRGGDAAETAIGGGDGGNGGAGADISMGLSGGIQNNGALTVSRTLTGGGAGIFGASLGGDGGDQDDAGTGDQDGGNGGASRQINIFNTAAISANGGSSAGFVHGISAQAIGGDGGTDNGDGGTGATININATALN